MSKIDAYNKEVASQIKSEHKLKATQIRRRLKEFTKPKDRFVELCFCICTPQSQALKVAQVINEANIDLLTNADEKRLCEQLASKTRFHKNKTRYIIHARRFSKDIDKLPKDPVQAREWLVKNIKGLGYKEASHFLRNIGYRNICIIDRHVITIMHDAGVFMSTAPPKNPRQYLEMEQAIKDYAASIKIDVDELDLLMWSMRTGVVFK